MKPHRVQLSRKKGWRKPENTVVVARPSVWGNPFKAEYYGRDSAVSFFRSAIAAASHERPFISEKQIKLHLRGKNLACWCPLDSPCHADVLLEIANA